MLNLHMGYTFSFPDGFDSHDLTLLVALLSRIGRPAATSFIEVQSSDISTLTGTKDLETHKILRKILQTYPCITAAIGEVDEVSGSAYTKTGSLFLTVSRHCTWGGAADTSLKTENLILVPNEAILLHLERTHNIRSFYDLVHLLMDDYILMHGAPSAETPLAVSNAR